ncbi:MAG TPA: flagellar assembly protein FliW [Candidatus Acidoferrales bacterium]|nr:flagellar assembly protein FliW [Candidatus Acidoferrales bacterium]
MVRIPTGLLGFEQIKDYVLKTNPEEAPFAWLHVGDDSGLAFVVVDPFIVMPAYLPDIPKVDADFLQLSEPKDALLLSIVTIKDGEQPTTNLKGPIVINRHTHVGKQVIIANAADYSLKHPLPVAAE